MTFNTKRILVQEYCNNENLGLVIQPNYLDVTQFDNLTENNNCFYLEELVCEFDEEEMTYEFTYYGCKWMRQIVTNYLRHLLVYISNN